MEARDLDDRIGYRMVRAAMRVRKVHADALATCGLLPNHHAVLAVLAIGGPEYQKRLAAKTTVDAGDLVGYLDVLQEKGFVVRERDANDRRRLLVDLSDEGRRKLAEADAVLDSVERDLFGGLSPTERSELVGMLDVVHRNASPASMDL